MSLMRGRFGIEYSAKPRRRNSSNSGKIVISIIAFIAVVSFIISSARKYSASRQEAKAAQQAEEELKKLDALRKRNQTNRQIPENNSAQNANGENDGGDNVPSEGPTGSQDQPPSPPPLDVPSRSNRPVRVQNLLMKLEEAEKQSNIVMAIATIEELRNIPGEPLADSDDMLARRLGKLNVKWLFELGNKQWVVEVKVRRGDNATRIAKAHGSSIDSLTRLNNLSDPNDIKIGSTIKVMNHPRLNLTVHRRARYADLHLNGKFFNRYDLLDDVDTEQGIYKAEKNVRQQLDRLGLKLSREDRNEIGTLLPVGATISISEF